MGMNLETVRELARSHHVRRLELFGSASRNDPLHRDYDFLVVFEPLPPLEHGRAYLSLWQALEATLHHKVDLVELEAVKNPFFLKSIEQDRTLVYAA
jgi:uncharacterized protein